MTRRSVPEWIGSTPDTAIPPRVRLRVFETFGGVCQLSDRKIFPGDKWQLDHIVALSVGGEHRESNLQPVLDIPHKAKTRADVAAKAKADRLRKKHIGAMPQKPKSKWKRKVNGQTVLRSE